MTAPRLFSPVSAILLAGLVAITVAGYLFIPAGTILPIHWGIDGAADNWLPRDLALLVTVLIVAVLWAILLAVDRFAPAIRAEGGRHVLRTALTAITGLLVALQGGIVAIGIGLDVDMVRIVALGLAVLLVVLGNVLPKTQPNRLAGVRIPSTLNDPANWQATHRLTGWLWIAAGLGLFLAALVIPAGPWLLASVIGAVIVPLVAATLYSLSFTRRAVRR